MKATKLTKKQWLDIFKTLFYVGVSAVIGAAIAYVQEKPELFGIYAPIVNVVLVTLKQVFTKG